MWYATHASANCISNLQYRGRIKYSMTCASCVFAHWPMLVYIQKQTPTIRSSFVMNNNLENNELLQPLETRQSKLLLQHINNDKHKRNTNDERNNETQRLVIAKCNGIVFDVRIRQTLATIIACSSNPISLVCIA